MCGIAGIFRFDEKPLDSSELDFILQQIAHRGRDDQGLVCVTSQLALGHRRLSIIDLNDSADQPIEIGLIYVLLIMVKFIIIANSMIF